MTMPLLRGGKCERKKREEKRKKGDRKKGDGFIFPSNAR